MNLLDVFDILVGVTVWCVAFKAVTIGSDFSFYYWYKHGDIYRKWYASRETFKDYLNNNTKEK
jgi:hypothetical protein